VLHGIPPRCRYWSLQVFLPGAKSNGKEQCLRDREIDLDADGSFTVVISRLKDRPKWATKNWIEVPETSSKCILCLRAYCPKPGEAFKAPDVWFGCRAITACSSCAGARAVLGPAVSCGNQERVMGMWAAQTGPGAPQHRLVQAGAANLALLALFDGSVSPLARLLGWQPLPSPGLVLPLAALVGVAWYKASFQAVRRLYRGRALSGLKGLVPNVSVQVPDPKGDLKGHPCHLYFTIPYDATQGDVRIDGYLRGGFTYTSVHAYGWHSLPPANSQFRYDETLSPNADAADKYTVFLTTKPTYVPGSNEINVSEERTGLCLIRLIYPDSQDEVNRCTPRVMAVPYGCRKVD
jgi:hypothetical protein